MSELDTAKFRAEDARQVLNNAAFKISIQRIKDHVEAKTLACDPDNRDAALRVVIAKQVTHGIIRELNRLLADGEVAEIQLSELDPKRRLFRR